MPDPPKLPDISLVATAFGAVTGIVTSFVIDPLTRHIPVPLVEEFVTDLLKPLLLFGVAALFAYVASRIDRLDRFLNRHIDSAATVASLILAFTLLLRAATPISLTAIGTAALVAAETYIFLGFCAVLVQQSMQAVADSQEEEYMERREREAQDIAMEALSEGAPDAATAMYGLDIAGQYSRAVISGCYLFVMTGYHFFAIWVVVTLSASLLYRVPIIWSVLTGFVMALAAMKTVSGSMDIGRHYADQIPVDEKYRPIRPDRES